MHVTVQELFLALRMLNIDTDTRSLYQVSLMVVALVSEVLHKTTEDECGVLLMLQVSQSNLVVQTVSWLLKKKYASGVKMVQLIKTESDG